MDPVSPQPLLDVKNLSYAFHAGLPVFEDVSFTLNAGEVVSVVGPSGCGKSTLLSLLAQLREESVGTITRNYRDAQMIFQDSALLPWRTVSKNVQLTGELQPKAPSTLDINTALSLVGLTNDADKYPHQLSGGMKMRVSLARALVGGAELLFCDEPFSSIDEITRESLNDLLLSIQREHRFGVLFVTHNISEAVYLSDRILVMQSDGNTSTRISADIPIALGAQRDPSTRFRNDFHFYTQQVHAVLRRGTT
jgi:NitT/TauT family transport system ATP-binding protein